MGSSTVTEFINAVDEQSTADLAGQIQMLASGYRVPDIVHACFMVACKVLIDTTLAHTQPKDLVKFTELVCRNTIEGAILERGGIDPEAPDAAERAMRALGYKR